MNTLPELTLTAAGDVLDVATGAIIPQDDAAAVPTTIKTALDTYARARVKAEALGMRMADMRDPYIAAMDAGLAADAEYQALQAERAEALFVVDSTHAALGAYFQDRADKVSMDVKTALVTWPKPRETWSLAKPASWYAEKAARAGLARLIGEDHADTVLAWLAPTAKVGAVPEVRITIRGADGS